MNRLVLQTICLFTLMCFSCNAHAPREWQVYVWKSVSQCLESYPDIQNCVLQYQMLATCYRGTWNKRIMRKDLRQVSTWTKHTVSSPYSHGLMQRTGIQATSLVIRVHVLLRMNLTLEKLDIEHSLSGCVNGWLKVSSIHIAPIMN